MNSARRLVLLGSASPRAAWRAAPRRRRAGGCRARPNTDRSGTPAPAPTRRRRSTISMPTIRLANDKTLRRRRRRVGARRRAAGRAGAGAQLPHRSLRHLQGTRAGRARDVAQADLSLSAAERADGWTLTCVSAAAEDLVLDIEDLGLPPDLAARTLPCRIDSIERPAPDVAARAAAPAADRRAALAGRAVHRRHRPGRDAAQLLDRQRRRGRRGPARAARAPRRRRRDERLLVRPARRPTTCCACTARSAPSSCATPPGCTWCCSPPAPASRRSRRCSANSPCAAERSSRARRRSTGATATRPTSTGSPTPPAPARHRRSPSCRCCRAPAPAGAGARGHVQDVLLQRPYPWAETVVYACGSPAMIDDARAALAAAGLPPRRFLSDAFVSSD